MNELAVRPVTILRNGYFVSYDVVKGISATGNTRQEAEQNLRDKVRAF